VLEGLLALTGVADNMVRDPGWRMMDAGRRIERSLQLTALLQGTVVEQHAPGVDSLVVESVLTAAESIVTYRRRYQAKAQVVTVLELLIRDRQNPRSVAYQLNRLAEDLHELPDGAGSSRPEQLVEDLRERLAGADLRSLVELDNRQRRPGLQEFLAGVHGAFRELSEAVGVAHFPRDVASRPF
jgi:uncharacterized alpha-E superfamily protein